MQANENIEILESDLFNAPADKNVLSVRVERNPDVSCRIEDDEHALLYNPDTDNSILIDDSGLLIWNYIEESRTVAEIMTFMTGCYSDCPEADVLQKDVVLYIRNLIPEFALEIN